ncbi:MAG: metallophosphoesterase [Clostridia bacterium]
MKVFAISDLHLPGRSDKPMNVFGQIWDGYDEKIRQSWAEKVSDDDIVLLSGDLSWAMRMEDVVDDVEYVNSMKGKKVILKGNHDYWWQTISKVRAMLPNDMYAIQNDCIRFGNVLICGSRGWTCPNTIDFTKDDEKIYLRETERLRLSMKQMQSMRQDGDKVIAMMHFPPFNVKRENSNFTDIFEEFGVENVIYGHLHGKDSLSIKKVTRGGVNYYLTSCDLCNFELQNIDID